MPLSTPACGSEIPPGGVRDLEAVVAEADANGLALNEIVTMPANNLSLILLKPRQAEGPQ